MSTDDVSPGDVATGWVPPPGWERVGAQPARGRAARWARVGAATGQLVERARRGARAALVFALVQAVVARVSIGAARRVGSLLVCSPRGAARAISMLARWLARPPLSQVPDPDDVEALEQAEADRAQLMRARWLKAGAAATAAAVPVLAWTAPRLLGLLLGAAAAAVVLGLLPRRGVAAVVVAGGAGGAVWMWVPQLLVDALPAPPVEVWWIAAAAATVTLGWLGRPLPEDVEPIDCGLPPAEGPLPLQAPVVAAALGEIGIPRLRAPGAVRAIADPHRRGQGTQLDLELACAASEVLAHREALAAALRQPLELVWPAQGPSSAAHLALYLCDVPMREQLQPAWPLLDGRPIDLFAPQPMATDRTGEWVMLQLAYQAALVAAKPRMGKTYILRQLAVTAGLDPRAKVYALDGKGTGDLSPTRQFAHFYSRGDTREEVIGRVLPALRELRDEMRRRAEVIDGLDEHECPDSKVTSQLADRAELDLGPIVLIADEIQAYLGYGADSGRKADKAVRDEIAGLLVDLAKRGPALGIIIVVALHNVSDDTIPRDISLQLGIRIALRLKDHAANNQVLGAGAYSRGLDATKLDERDKGISWLDGVDSAPQIVRWVAGLDKPAAARIAAAGRRLRLEQGQLTGDAAPDTAAPVAEANAGAAAATPAAALAVVPPTPDVLDDVRRVLDARERRPVGLGGLLQQLQLLDPARYTGWSVSTLSGELREAQARVGGVHVPELGRTAKGTRWEWLPSPDLTG